jgi:hypothetical protein
VLLLWVSFSSLVSSLLAESIAGMSFDPRWSHERPIQDRKGKRWNFAYWYSGYSVEKSRKSQRLFFWDDSKAQCGVIVFLPGYTVPYSRLRDLMKNLAAKATLREKHERPLRFPLEDHYWDFGSLTEETI